MTGATGACPDPRLSDSPGRQSSTPVRPVDTVYRGAGPGCISILAGLNWTLPPTGDSEEQPDIAIVLSYPTVSMSANQPLATYMGALGPELHCCSVYMYPHHHTSTMLLTLCHRPGEGVLSLVTIPRNPPYYSVTFRLFWSDTSPHTIFAPVRPQILLTTEEGTHDDHGFHITIRYRRPVT